MSTDTESSKTLTQSDYEMAVHSQGAANLGGLAHALSRVVAKIQNEVRAQGGGSSSVNNHPIVRLYLEQMMHLCDVGYTDAYNECRDRAGMGAEECRD